ncbi:MAG TPA: Tex family protein [Candidatus Avimonas sp.]|nr:Tex family protein [Candidatus Avimonas sp.]HQD38245.1 Tex family protein [Candidatus Avimonas sp.]
MNIPAVLAQELSLKLWQVEAAIRLIDDGNTIPFIARYRKEVTGSLDDQSLRALTDRLKYLRNLDEQREKVRAAISEQGALTDEISASLDAAETLAEIEDIYRPFRPKRKTRASIAKEKGLQPLADLIYQQKPDSPPPLELAAAYIDPEKGVNSAEEALQGAQDIIAEMISDDPGIRRRLRAVCMENGELVSKAAQEDTGVYQLYSDFHRPLKRTANHQVLAINRGEREEFLKVQVAFDRERGVGIACSAHVREGSPCTETVRAAAADAYDRLIFPSIEREIRSEITDRASEDAIKVFALNLRHLLLQPPLRGRVVLGIDPGYRTGCKLAVVDQTGKVLDTGVIYPVPPHSKIEQSKQIVTAMIKNHRVQVIAIGNGTASRETEVFVAGLIRELDMGLSYMVVSEAGASVYSASELAALEFPEFDVSLRSAVSIARRLQDPLAELVKIEPKAIGVGQYQHDMPQKRLSEALDGVVESCVNLVGVDLNTASAPLLARVSGLSASVAKNIVSYREQNGAFKSRFELIKVPKLGPKTFEQCAGFLRVPESEDVLDNTAVHPESYDAARKLLSLCGFSAEDVKNKKVSSLPQKAEEMGIARLAEQLNIGEPTLLDIISELTRPGRDPRDELPAPMLRTDVMSIEDLKPGMELAGTVRNVTDFGAFVDIGVHQDGLVHISQISSSFIRHPSEALKVGDIVTVWVMNVDVPRSRISLTMKPPKQQ